MKKALLFLLILSGCDSSPPEYEYKTTEGIITGYGSFEGRNLVVLSKNFVSRRIGYGTTYFYDGDNLSTENIGDHVFYDVKLCVKTY